jgi:hypothetical protein
VKEKTSSNILRIRTMGKNNYYVFEFVEFLGNKEEIVHKFNVYCSEEELIGVKEDIAMDLEKEYGHLVFCQNIKKADKVKSYENDRK